jgi:hypothetical protein
MGVAVRGRTIRIIALGFVAAFTAVLAACGDDGGSGSDATTDEPPAETNDRAETTGSDQGLQLSISGLTPLEGEDGLTGDTGTGTGTDTGGRTGAGGYDEIEDPEGYLEVSVPGDWGDRQAGSPGFSDADGANGSGVVMFASTDVSRFQEKWGVPGMSLAATSSPSQIGQIDGLIDANNYADDCEGGGQKRPYDDGVYIGKIATWRGCGGTTEYTVVAAEPADATYIVLVTIAIPEGEADDAVRREILDTFRVVRTPPGLI